MPNQTSFLFDIPTVTELTGKIKTLLEQNFTDVLVEGEISNLKKSANGHIYFTLKDAGAQMPCVLWRSTVQRLNLNLSDGQQLVIGGDIQLYAPHGRYQMIVNLVQQAGIGKLQQAFERLKAKLQAEGLFDEARKRKLPEFPQTIGVVTSKTTAAFQDIRSTLEKRWPLAKILLYHAGVQGVGAAAEIARGIQYFSGSKNADVLIISRGGGSLEDLWPFNEEIVARAVFDCSIPVISAVGHEIDFSISDFVADVRAATPTHGAVLATPDINEIRMYTEDLYRKIELNTLGKMQMLKEKISAMAKSHALLAVRQKLQQARTALQIYHDKITGLTGQKLNENQKNLLGLIHRLEKQSPNEPLKKGFVRVWQDSKWIRNPELFNEKEPAELEWENGIRKI